MSRPGLHWPNTTQVDAAARSRFLAGRFAAAMVMTVTPAEEARWVRDRVRFVGYRIYEPAGDLAAPADVADRHAEWIAAVDPRGFYQLLNEPDVEYPSLPAERFASWWDVCAGFLLQRFPALQLGFPAPSIGGPDNYLSRVFLSGGLRRASWIAERGYWQDAAGMASPLLGQRWRRSVWFRLPIVVAEFANSSPTAERSAKAADYLRFAASLPRAVIPAGAFIGAGGDPHWDTPAAGRLWIDDATCAAIGAAEGDRLDMGDVQQVRSFAPLIVKYAGINKLPASVVAGLIDVESGGQPDATSPDNGPGLGHALGLMQVLEGHFAVHEDGHDPETNIRVGCAILRAKTDAYGGRLGSGLAAYYGAVDASGNPTSGTDLTGTSGVRYVAEVEAAAKQFADLDLAAAPGSEVDPDFAAYAPHTGTWREAAVNLKGVADDALTAGRKIVADVGTTWGAR